jgi:hypothetical protein
MARKPSTGTLFQVSISGTPTNIPNKGVSGFGAKKNILDASALEDAAMQFVDDRPDPGTITTKVIVDEATAIPDYLFTRANTSGVTDTFYIKPSGTTKVYTGTGIIMSFLPDYSEGAVQLADLEVKFTGPLTKA